MNLLDANDRAGEYPQSWYAATSDLLPPLEPLEGRTRADVCVIGGGYTGLSAALHLARQGYDVVLLEAQRVGFGASGRNGGQVGSGQRWAQSELEARLGRDAALQLWSIAEEAKALVRELAESSGAEWQDGVVHATRSRAGAETAAAEGAFLSAHYGYDRIEVLDRQALADLIGTDAFAGGVVDWGAGHVHPLRLALGLARRAAEAGVRLHERSRVTGLAAREVETEHGSVGADHVVLAANGYVGGLQPAVASRVMPINNFVIATEPLGDAMPLARPVAVADDRFVVNYWRAAADGRLIFGGGESYRYAFPADIARVVERRLLRIYPHLRGIDIASAWGGTLAITRSRLPNFGRPAPGVWTASGYSGHGVAMAVMAGRMIAEAIRGEAERFDLMASLPTPPFPGGSGIRSPLLALAMAWYAMRDRLGI